MERHTTTMRAARYLLGAGTFAAAMVAMTGSASAQTDVCYDGGEGDPTFCGHVFTDATGGTVDTFDEGEGLPAVLVAITNASGDNVANSPTPSGSNCPDPIFCGYYSFVVPDAAPGDEYWICLISDLNNDGVIDDAEDDCRDTTLHPESVKVTVGTSLPFVDFEVGDDDAGEEQPPSDVWGVGTGTPGYWKNHPEAWPADGIVVGGVTYLNQQTAVAPNKTIYDAIRLMGKVSGDKTVSMFAALISAKLNSTLSNNTVCVAPTIELADAWMAAHPVGSGVKASSPAWSEGADAWHTLLDDYNNGKLCAPHRG